MARLEKITSTSWKQPFKDRKKEFHLWGSHTEVANHCDLQDGTKRLLNIQFEGAHEINITDRFQITSGKEISFPQELQSLIKPIILDNPQSYFIVRVIDIDSDDDSGSEISTTGSSTIKTRIGQAQFRNSLMEYWRGQCAVTNTPLKAVLIASHIKPWARSTDTERLDKYNGLLLTPTLDSLFDKGLITFLEGGSINLAEEAVPYSEALGINEKMSIDIEEEHKKYLKYHRENIFKS